MKAWKCNCGYEYDGPQRACPRCSTHQAAILGGIGYKVTVIDNQVIFEEEICIHGHHAVFAFERPHEINKSPGIWWLVHLDTSSDRIPVSHIVAAQAWCNEMFGKSFEPYKGALTEK